MAGFTSSFTLIQIQLTRGTSFFMCRSVEDGSFGYYK